MFRQHYSLAETDPRFLALTADDILTELWAIHFWRDPEAAKAPDDDPDFDSTLRELGLEPPDPGDWEDL